MLRSSPSAPLSWVLTELQGCRRDNVRSRGRLQCVENVPGKSSAGGYLCVNVAANWSFSRDFKDGRSRVNPNHLCIVSEGLREPASKIFGVD